MTRPITSIAESLRRQVEAYIACPTDARRTAVDRAMTQYQTAVIEAKTKEQAA